MIEGGLIPVNALINGYYITNSFFSSSAAGPTVGGTDGVVDGCIFDDGSTLLTLAGSNCVINACNFYLGNNQINLGVNDNNVFSNCVFNYAEISSVKWDDNTVRALVFSNCSFIKNAQDAGTFKGFFYTDGATIVGDVSLLDCTFRNCHSGAIRLDANTTSYNVLADGCTFDGVATKSGYTQSTTMLALDMTSDGASAGNVVFNNCRFKNMHQTPMQITGTGAYTVKVSNSTFSNNTGTRSIEVAGSNAASSINVGNIVGDSKNLLAFSGAGSLIVSGWLKDWLTVTTSGGNKWVLVPFSGPCMLHVHIIGNPNPAGNVNYRMVIGRWVSCSFDFTGGNFITQITQTTEFTSTTPLGLTLPLSSALNSVGGGTQVTGLNAPGHIALSVPDTVADVTYDVQYLHHANI
jgi:hypothetical protein